MHLCMFFGRVEAIVPKEMIFDPSGVIRVISTEVEVTVPASNCVLEVG